MKEVCVFLLGTVFLTSCSISRLEKMGVYKEVSPAEFLKHVGDTSVIIIDVRTEAEYEKSHIEGAINISYFGGHFKEEFKAYQFEQSHPILIYCETQHRSLFVAKKIHRAGYGTIIDLDKGMMYWRKNEFPFVGDSIPKN